MATAAGVGGGHGSARWELQGLQRRAPVALDRHGLLRVPVDEGLEGVLRRQRTIEGAAIPVPTHPTVAVLATRKRGTQESIELVSARAAEIVADARAVADHVIVDMPPLGEVSDGLGAVVAVDHVIVVIRLGRTMQPALVAVRELIERTGATPVGFLVIGSRRPQR